MGHKAWVKGVNEGIFSLFCLQPSTFWWIKKIPFYFRWKTILGCKLQNSNKIIQVLFKKNLEMCKCHWCWCQLSFWSYFSNMTRLPTNSHSTLKCLLGACELQSLIKHCSVFLSKLSWILLLHFFYIVRLFQTLRLYIAPFLQNINQWQTV